MAVIYKAVPKGQPGVAGGGQIKYYAGIVRQQPVELRRFATQIAKMSTLTTVDVFAVLESFLEQLSEHLEDGKIVKLGDLGSFSPSLASKAEDEDFNVDQHTINRMKINFRPSKELKKRLGNIEYVKLSTDNDSEIVE